MDLNIPFLPPSVNTCFRTYKNRVIKSKLYREFEIKVKLYLDHTEYEPIEGEIKITIELYKKGVRKYDIDNRLKALLDVLETNKVYVDDSQIIELHVTKHNNALYDRTIVHINKVVKD